MNKEEVTFPIRIKKELWKKFKEKIPRSKSLNEAIIEIIEKEVRK